MKFSLMLIIAIIWYFDGFLFIWCFDFDYIDDDENEEDDDEKMVFTFFKQLQQTISIGFSSVIS